MKVRGVLVRPACAAVIAAAAAVWLAPSVTSRQEQQPPPFRTRTNIVRVDATVTDRGGNPVPALTADDFEVREDGQLQTISSFKFIAATGEPSDDRSLPIRSRFHAAAEAARDDVRVFLIFWNEYGISQFGSALRAREALTRVVLSAFGATDLVAVMDPLTPMSAVEFTRDRRALADHIQRLQGRRGVYLPPRSAVEEEQLARVNWNAPAVEPYRRQVTHSAIKAAAAHLGTLRDGRKTLVIVSESGSRGMGRGGMRQQADDFSDGVDLLHTVNDANTAVHVIDPRGLEVGGLRTGGAFETLAHGSGGDVHRSNDPVVSFQRIVRQASASYLLGYTRDVPLDGRFHEIKVRVKRGGYDVKARAGYWAPRGEEVVRAREAAAAAVLPPTIASAFNGLASPSSPRLVDMWLGTTPLADGRVRASLAWTPLTIPAGSPAPASVAVRITPAAGDPIDVTLDAAGTDVELPAGKTQIAVRVLDAGGEIIDRETRTLEMSGGSGPALTMATPLLHRARTPTELRTLLAAERPPIHAGREFVRTDRVMVRVTLSGDGAADAIVTGRLIDRRGAALVPLTTTRPAGREWYQVDLPLSSLAPGEFAILIEAQHGDARAETALAFRVTSR